MKFPVLQNANHHKKNHESNLGSSVASVFELFKIPSLANKGEKKNKKLKTTQIFEDSV
jgi:hypothetical protein